MFDLIAAHSAVVAEHSIDGSSPPQRPLSGCFDRIAFL